MLRDRAGLGRSRPGDLGADFHHPRVQRYRRGRSSPSWFWPDSVDYDHVNHGGRQPGVGSATIWLPKGLGMTDRDSLLAAYDALRLWVPGDPPPGLSFEQQGSMLRVVGQHRGFIDTARNGGVQGQALDSLIIEQRVFFAQRGEAVELKTRATTSRRICRICRRGCWPRGLCGTERMFVEADD